MHRCHYAMNSKMLNSSQLMSAVLFAGLVFLGGFATALEAHPYNRIVSVGGSLTEILYELGVDDRLVAVDTTSTYPVSVLENYPNVGYMRTLSAEPILSLNPDLVLVSSDAGPPQVLEQLREAGTRVEIIDDEPSVEGIYKKIRSISALMQEESKGEALIKTMEADFEEARKLIEGAVSSPRVLFLLSIGAGAPMAAGTGTSANTMIDLAGGKNAFPSIGGYKSVSPESIIVASPDYILIPERVYEAFGSREAIFELPELVATPAAQEEKLLVFDGLYLMGFGPRTIKAVLDLAISLHTELDAGDLGQRSHADE